eukprot:712754-Alexandrium_andersonii.AAC.1
MEPVHRLAHGRTGDVRRPPLRDLREPLLGLGLLVEEGTDRVDCVLRGGQLALRAQQLRGVPEADLAQLPVDH